MIYIFLLTSFIASLFAATNFHLGEVIVECPPSLTCTQRTSRFQTLVGEYRSIVHLKDTLRVMASDGGYQTFFYSLEQENEQYKLTIKFNMKPVIKEINIGFTDRNIDYNPLDLLSIREDEFFETQKLKESLIGLKQRLVDMGFPNNTHSYEVIEKDETVQINVVVTVGEPRIFKNITSNSKSSYVRGYLERKFLNLYNKPFDLNTFKIYLDDAQKELFSYGYYLIALDFNPRIKGSRVTLDIKVANEQLFAFDFKNLEQEHRDVIHALVVDLFRKYKRQLSELALKNALKEHYQHRALLNASVRIQTSEFVNSNKEIVHLYRIYFNEKTKTRLVNVSFTGNSFFKREKLEKMFKKEAFELASLNYYDEEYFAFFQEYLRTQYIQKGFVQARISDPVRILDAEKRTSSVEYSITEGTQAFVRSIDFEGIPPEMEEKILAQMKNKVGKAFNPLTMPDDIKSVSATLQEAGYYYAEVTNAGEADIVHYTKSGSDVDILYKVNAGPVIQLNRILYLGNDKTKKKVLSKKISLKQGEIITPAKTRDIETTLSATGLFNSVSVTPLRHNSKNTATDLLVRVQERDYGLLELAPGYRTDLGLKLTGTVTYQNIGGYNRSVTLQSQVNRRDNYMTINPNRRSFGQIFEHNETISYGQGDIFDTLIDGSASLSYQTRRFYDFDANIYRVTGTLSRDLTKRLSTSLTYAYEDISQYNAYPAFLGKFQIGSVTSAFTYDLRNSPVVPLKGAYFNLTTELANPYLLSQKQPDLTINYYKLVSRNRFYIPYKNGTLAISLVGGLQENLANKDVSVNGVKQKEGYIPPIKVFRLTGMDIIRGFTDVEMNYLSNGKTLSDTKIYDKAYMALMKIEPRYFINDTLMAGVFYDAGRVFVNSVNLGELRDSVGVTFKVVTPVGTLDFDYGIKLLRKRDENGKLESPGRFHVSIGFF